MSSEGPGGRKAGCLVCVMSDSVAVRTIARVFTCAAKIGEDVSMAATANQMVIRTLNASRSASAEFTFAKSFFDRYEYTPESERGASKALHTVVASKYLLPVVRNIIVVSQLGFTLKTGSDRLVCDVTTRNGILKKFYVPYEDGAAVLRAVFSKDSCTCNASVRSKFLLDMLSNFHGRLEEVTLGCSSSQFRVMSFVEDTEESVANDMLRTEMAVDAKEFEEFFLPKAGEVELTFSFRAYRAVLELAESFDVPLRLFFDNAGQPILFSIAYPGSLAPRFEALFIFATRQERTQGGGSSRTDLESTATHVTRPTPSTQRAATGSNSYLTTRDSRTPLENDHSQYVKVNDPSEADGGDDGEEDEFVEGTPPPS